MLLNEFDYNLPEELIAQTPCAKRDHSRLMVLNRKEKTIEEMGEEILDYCIKAASGEIIPKAVQLNQDDFIPWKRGVSL